MKKIGYSGGLSVNLEQVKCIKHINNKLIIEYKQRYEYLLNSFTEKYEIKEINDKIEMEYSDYENALDYKHEFDAMWENYLLETRKKNS